MRQAILLLALCCSLAQAGSVFDMMTPQISTWVQAPALDIATLDGSFPAIDWWEAEMFAEYITTQLVPPSNFFPWASANDWFSWFQAQIRTLFIFYVLFDFMEMLGGFFFVCCCYRSDRLASITKSDKGACGGYCGFRQDPITAITSWVFLRGFFFFFIGLGLIIAYLAWSNTIRNRIFLNGNLWGLMWFMVYTMVSTSGCLDCEWSFRTAELTERARSLGGQEPVSDNVTDKQYIGNVLGFVYSNGFVFFHRFLSIVIGLVVMIQAFSLKNDRYANYQLVAGGLFIFPIPFLWWYAEAKQLHFKKEAVTDYGSPFMTLIFFDTIPVFHIVGSVLMLIPASQINKGFFHIIDRNNWYGWVGYFMAAMAIVVWVIVFVYAAVKIIGVCSAARKAETKKSILSQ